MTRAPPPPTLLKLLTWPYLIVVLTLSAAVAGLLYRSAHKAVDEAAQQWLSTAIQRVGDEIDRQQRQADTVLRIALADGHQIRLDSLGEPNGLVRQLWSAVQFHPQKDGRISLTRDKQPSITVQRLGDHDALLEVLELPGGPVRRQHLEATALHSAASAASQKWTIDLLGVPRADGSTAGTRLPASEPELVSRVDIDSAAKEAALTRSRAATDHDGRVLGTLTTTVSLAPVQDSLKSLKLPPQAVAFVVERSGRLVASSAGPIVRKLANGQLERIHVQDSDESIVRAAYDRTLPHMGNHSVEQPGRLTLSDSGQTTLISSFGRIAQAGGDDWALIVAAPREVFTRPLHESLIQAAAATLAAVAALLLIASWIRNRLARDVAALSGTLQGVANGDLDTPPPTTHCAELNDLSEALRRAQLRVQHDRSLGLTNREALLTRLHDRMRPGRRHNDATLLALLAVDLNRFREVNRVHGHAAGDFVLQTLGKRLRQTLRDADLVARWTSDEFIILLEGVLSVDSAERVRDQIERVLRDPVELGPGQEAVEIDGTVGMAILDVHVEPFEPEALLRKAQADLAQRKPQVRRPTVDR